MGLWLAQHSSINFYFCKTHLEAGKSACPVSRGGLLKLSVALLQVTIFSVVFIAQGSGGNTYLNPHLFSFQDARRSPLSSQTDEVNPFQWSLCGAQGARAAKGTPRLSRQLGAIPVESGRSLTHYHCKKEKRLFFTLFKSKHISQVLSFLQ